MRHIRSAPRAGHAGACGVWVEAARSGDKWTCGVPEALGGALARQHGHSKALGLGRWAQS